MKDNQKPELALLPYLALARDLSALLEPAAPRAHFRSELYHSLVEAAREQQAGTSSMAPRGDDSSAGISRRVARWMLAVPGQDRRWVWGAAAVGSAVSVASIAAYVLRHRSRRAA